MNKLTAGFKKFLDVERLGKDEVEGILNGTCFIFPKLDGTNASIWLDIDCFDGKYVPMVKCGSRTRELGAGKKDNFDFYTKYVIENAHTYYAFLTDHPELHLFGEYMKPHTIKNYRDDVWNDFFVFDVYDSLKERYLTYNEYEPLLATTTIRFLSPLCIAVNPSLEQLTNMLTNGPQVNMKEGCKGEGIVIKNYEYVNKYGRLTYGKLVREEFKEENAGVFGPLKLQGPRTDEADFVNQNLGYARVEKILGKLNGENLDKPALIGKYLNLVYYELIQEELWDFVKKSRRVIDFSKLRYMTYEKAKSLAPQLFGVQIQGTESGPDLQLQLQSSNMFCADSRPLQDQTSGPSQPDIP